MSKTRVGSRLRRRYDVPRTPLDRLLDCPGPKHPRLATLRALRDRLDPFKISATVDRKLRTTHASRTHDTILAAGLWKLPPLWKTATTRFPTRAWKTLRVSHSSHSPSARLHI